MLSCWTLPYPYVTLVSPPVSPCLRGTDRRLLFSRSLVIQHDMTRHGMIEHQRRSEGPGHEAAAEGASEAPPSRRGEQHHFVVAAVIRCWPAPSGKQPPEWVGWFRWKRTFRWRFAKNGNNHSDWIKQQEVDSLVGNIPEGTDALKRI